MQPVNKKEKSVSGGKSVFVQNVHLSNIKITV